MENDITSLMLQQIQEINQRDEGQILQELAGETIDEFIYEITDKKLKKRTVKLSWAGTREMARYRGNIAVSDPMITDNDGYVRIVVKATDLKRNFSVFGGCHQPRLMKIKVFDEHDQPAGYKEQEDPHYFTKALSKAQRNALQSIIPADFVARMIDKFLVLSGKEPLKQFPKPKESKPRVSKDLPELIPEDITDFNSLERYAFNRYHLQPKQMYQQLGYENRLGCQGTPWECFLQLKGIFES